MPQSLLKCLLVPVKHEVFLHNAKTLILKNSNHFHGDSKRLYSLGSTESPKCDRRSQDIQCLIDYLLPDYAIALEIELDTLFGHAV